MESSDNKNSTPAPAAPVMDVQPPKKPAPAGWGANAAVAEGIATPPAPEVTVPTAAPATEASEPAAMPAPAAVVQPAPAAPVETEAAPEVSVTPPELATAPASAEVADSGKPGESSTDISKPATDNQPNPMAIPSKPVKHATPNATVIIAIVVALLLVAVAVGAYVKTNQKAAPTNKTATTKVTSGDVTQTQAQVDDGINALNDTTDLSSNDLSDSALGL